MLVFETMATVATYVLRHRRTLASASVRMTGSWIPRTELVSVSLPVCPLLFIERILFIRFSVLFGICTPVTAQLELWSVLLPATLFSVRWCQLMHVLSFIEF